MAVHVRRGDLHERAISRWVSNNQMTRVMSDLVNALTEVRALWEAARSDDDKDRAAASSSAAAAPPLPSPRRLPLAIHVHVMTQNDWSRSERLPKRAWSALCLGANLTFTAHVDTDPFVTMHHLIAADVRRSTAHHASPVPRRALTRHPRCSTRTCHHVPDARWLRAPHPGLDQEQLWLL